MRSLAVLLRTQGMQNDLLNVIFDVYLGSRIAGRMK